MIVKQTEQEKYRDRIMENGNAHVIYYADSAQDIIHPYSVKGYEVLSDNFIEFLEKYSTVIPAKAPILLEIIGNPMSDEDKDIIDNAIWTHFCIRIKIANTAARACIKRCLLYSLFTVLSSVLLFMVVNEQNEIISNMAYIPFWFFGYRLLIYLIIDAIPTLKECRWYRQLACIKLIFSGKDRLSPNTIDSSNIAAEVKEYEHYTSVDNIDNSIINKYIINDGIVFIGCSISSIEDIIYTPVIEGREFLSAEFSCLLEGIEPFFTPDVQKKLALTGAEFSDEEKRDIEEAKRNYYGFRIAEIDSEYTSNIIKIIAFGLFTVISSIIIFSWGGSMNVGWHEFVIMIFWFFADYLLEFILISGAEIRRSRKILQGCKEMEILYYKDLESF